jgi:hypothetical protein
MRKLAVLIVLGGAVLGCGSEAVPATRHDVAPDLKVYPQGTPKEALASVVKAVEGKRIDYLLAQIADPEWVDDRVKSNGGKFSVVVEEAKRHLLDDPGPLKQLKLFEKEGEWAEEGDSASVGHKDVADRRVFFRKVGGRWYFQNRVRSEK